MKVEKCPLILSTLRLGLTLVITLMVISSPIFILVNPASAAAPSISTDNGSLSAPSTIGQDGSDFTTQAALGSLTARPTNNIVNTNSFYDVVFLTASSGAIKSIEVTFPAGTTIPSGAFFNEAEGIGPGTASKFGQTITYTVNNAVNVPAGTKIRLEFANINNPLQVSASYQVIVATRDAANNIIDGHSQSTAYTIKQIGTNAIANNAITSPKIADVAVTTPKIADNSITSTKIATGAVTTGEIADGSVTSGDVAPSFIRSKQLLDGQNGWDPDDSATSFFIVDFDISPNSHIFFGNGDGSANLVVCGEEGLMPGGFDLSCSQAPSDGAELRYTVIDQPNT